MRRILVDYARNHQAAKRGAGMDKVSLDEAVVVSKQNLGELLALDHRHSPERESGLLHEWIGRPSEALVRFTR